MSSEPVYLDHHATTPCDPRVVDAMLPCLTETFGNPAAISHAHGKGAALALDEARRDVAGFFGVDAAGVVFTSGATESNNLVLLGLLDEGDHLITSAIEHSSILAPAKALTARGIDITILEVDREGFVDPAEVESAIASATKLVSINWANGEIGTIEPMNEIALVCRERGVRFHSDATQAVGKIEVDLGATAVDLISLSAHKFYGPKGVGALVISGGRKPRALLTGGGQEKGVRSGTVNVPGAVGLAKALDLRRSEMGEEAARLARLRNDLAREVLDSIEGVRLNGPALDGDDGGRLPGNLNLTFRGVDAEALMMNLRGFSLSSGAACSSGSAEPSHVLKAIGLTDAEAMSSIRFGLGKSTDRAAIERLADDLKRVVPRVRGM